jgi:hypothetical protein
VEHKNVNYPVELFSSCLRLLLKAENFFISHFLLPDSGLGAAFQFEQQSEQLHKQHLISSIIELLTTCHYAN